MKLPIHGDDIGYVKLLDVMGNEWTPADDARTSTDKGNLGPEKDSALQGKLRKDTHTSPFEGVVVKIEIMTPLFVLREIDRHRTMTKVGDKDVLEEIVTPEENGRKWFARNEMSGRYIQLPNLYYHPAVVRAQGVKPVTAEVAAEFRNRGHVFTKMVRELYDWAIEHGIERGQARIYNTQNQYTRIRLTGSLKNWCDFLTLRLPANVLEECREVAKAIETILAARFPSVMQQWREYSYEAVRFTRSEMVHLRSIVNFLCEGSPCVSSAEMQRVIEKVRQNHE
jgi:thymidylate synthase (FAD)